MHALEITVKLENREGAIAELDELKEMVSGQPGFVAGYWIGFSDDRGISLVVYESEADAQASADMAQSNPADRGNVTFERVEIGEVLAHV